MDKYLLELCTKHKKTYIHTFLLIITHATQVLHPMEHTHALSHTLWLTQQTHWGLISLLRECVCQAWLVCQSPAVHHTLPCCASKQHWCPPFAVSHISNACCYHLALSILNPARLPARLAVQMHACLCLASGFIHCYVLRWIFDWHQYSIMPWLTVWKSEWMKVFFRDYLWPETHPALPQHKLTFLGTLFPAVLWNFIPIHKTITFLIISHTYKCTNVAQKCTHTFKIAHRFSTSLAGKPQSMHHYGAMCGRRKKAWKRRRVGELLETRPALSAPSQKVLLLFMVTFWTGCDPTGVPAL